MARTSTYLNFPRHTEEVFHFYRSVFGGDFVGGIHRFRDMPTSPGLPQIAEADLNLVVHIELLITGGHTLMGTDAPESMGFKINFGNNQHINLEPDSRAEAERLFKALAEGGKISMPLQDMFWGAYYGSCSDKFGVSWMINCDEAKTKKMKTPLNADLDLVFERKSTLTLEQLWQGWTDPQTLMKWFCPRPWKVTDCRIDLRSGGEFSTVMEGPNGEKQPNSGCYLEVVPYQKIVWSNVLSKGFRPTTVEAMGFGFVVSVEFERIANGSLYRAVVQHSSAQDRIKHEQMGFQEGWGLAFNQLLEEMKAKSF